MSRLRIAAMCVFALGTETFAQSANSPGAGAPIAHAPSKDVSSPQAEKTFTYSLLENGDFAERSELRPVPGWRSSAKVAQSASDGKRGVRLETDEWIEAPLPAYAPRIDSLAIRVSVEGSGVLVGVRDGSGATFERVISGASATNDFVIRTRDIRAALGRDPMPRLTLRLTGTANTFVRAVDATVDLPCPSETELRDEIVKQIKTIFATWFECSLDDVGPRKTAFFAKGFDAITGLNLGIARTTGFNSIYSCLFDAAEAHDDPELRARCDAFLEDYLALQFQPETGLPRAWDPVNDVPDETTPVEIALPLAFVIDVAERGPEQFRARARAIAKQIGDTVLAHGLIPDGTCAPSYVPKDGTANVNVAQLRRLDVPAQLVRLSKLLGDDRYRHATREPLATLEFTNFWAGQWDAIDPGFDDEFGHYGARAATIVCAMPDELLFRRFVLEGWQRYAPLWREALLLGGNVAADQVRCWKVGVDLTHVEPSLRAEMGPLLRLAARSHFKGEQYGNGAWGDVTIYAFDPKSTLQVGDLPGAPQNLLQGLAAVYVDELGLRTDEIRAMYTAVWRSTVTQYGRPYGFLLDREPHKGANSAAGSLRVLTGLVEMLRALSVRR